MSGRPWLSQQSDRTRFEQPPVELPRRKSSAGSANSRLPPYVHPPADRELREYAHTTVPVHASEGSQRYDTRRPSLNPVSAGINDYPGGYHDQRSPVAGLEMDNSRSHLHLRAVDDSPVIYSHVNSRFAPAPQEISPEYRQRPFRPPSPGLPLSSPSVPRHPYGRSSSPHTLPPPSSLPHPDYYSSRQGVQYSPPPLPPSRGDYSSSLPRLHAGHMYDIYGRAPYASKDEHDVRQNWSHPRASAGRASHFPDESQSRYAYRAETMYPGENVLPAATRNRMSYDSSVREDPYGRVLNESARRHSGVSMSSETSHHLLVERRASTSHHGSQRREEYDRLPGEDIIKRMNFDDASLSTDHRRDRAIQYPPSSHYSRVMAAEPVQRPLSPTELSRKHNRAWDVDLGQPPVMAPTHTSPVEKETRSVGSHGLSRDVSASGAYHADKRPSLTPNVGSVQPARPSSANRETMSISLLVNSPTEPVPPRSRSPVDHRVVKSEIINVELPKPLEAKPPEPWLSSEVVKKNEDKPVKPKRAAKGTPSRRKKPAAESVPDVHSQQQSTAIPIETLQSAMNANAPSSSTSKPAEIPSNPELQEKVKAAKPPRKPRAKKIIPESQPVVVEQPGEKVEKVRREPSSKRSTSRRNDDNISISSDDGMTSSDPDDLDASMGKHMSSAEKRQLVRYMIKLRRREKALLAKYERRRLRKLARLQGKLADTLADDHLGRGKASESQRKKRARVEDSLEAHEEMTLKKKPRSSRKAVHVELVETEEMRKERVQRELETKREQMWQTIAKRGVPIAHQMMQSFTAIRQQNALKIAQMARQALIRSKPTKQQLAKDLTARTKRAAREMLSFWKRNEKEERELRKKAEKEKMESRKREEEMREAQRQARKLNFLITQTELYSHFVGKKLGVADDDASADAKIPEPAAQAEPFRDIDFDTEDDEQLKARAAVQAQAALAKQQEAARQFDTKTNSNIQLTETTVDQMNFLNPTSFKSGPEVEQPSMLTVTLKSYQAKGLNWLAGLWEQGINGILADEMGLGKTIQSISLMAHLAETHNLWGPFLVVSPASTLPNWQQEIARFTPQLKVLPYWGDADDRKTLRKLLNPKKLGLVDSPFHVAVTSYQLIVSDYQYFGRIKWQYMILDEAQAIKSSSSQRWKTLLKLPTRNRLLLTGTPIQNSMQELWSLLHFIMPTLFDSHEEFNEWFSKDIESHVESGGEGKGLNEEQLRRLHMILKPFMLRRVKRDVENELAEKIEIELPCTLTWRQRELYRRLKSKISVRELLDGLGSSSSVNTNTANGNADIWGDDDGGDTLMNLVMQFRKVCNHPELFERSTIKGPFYALPVELMDAYGGARTSLADAGWSMIRYRVPTLIWNTAWNVSRIRWHGVKILSNPANVSEDLYASLRRSRSQPADAKSRTTSTFDFLALCDTSPSEFAFLSDADLLERWVHHLLTREALWRLQEYFARNDLETPARHTLSLSRRPLQVYIPGLPDIWSFTTEEEPHHILSRLEVASTESAVASPVEAVCSSRSFLTEQQWLRYNTCVRALLYHQAIYLLSVSRTDRRAYDYITSHTPDTLPVEAGLLGKPTRPGVGWGFLTVPSVERLVVDSGKMLVLDKLLATLKAGGHRVLIFFQMTLMMDLMEEYLASRQYGYLRLDGSTSILDRRDLVTDWQTRPEIFVFILSTRAGGLGINLTAADTVIFYDSDWNPTVDQQAMDRSHRLGQTKQVTVYRLITTGTIEERIVQRARQKDQIQKVVISGGEFKQQVEFKPKEVLSLLLDDEEMAEKVRKESALRRAEEEQKQKVKAAKAAATKARKNVGGARSKQGTPRASGSPAPSVGGPSRKTTITARSSLSTTSGLPGTPLSNTDSPSVAAPTSGSAAGMGAGPSQ